MTCFKIDGEWLTEHSRNLVLEGRVDHAFKTLTDGLDGFGYDHAVALLRGDTKLVGVNDLELEDDDATEYKSKLKWMYGGVFVTSSGKHFRPYAVVTSWGAKDIVDNASPIPNRYGSEITNPQFKSARASFLRDGRFYADDPQNDIVRHVNIRTGQMSKERNLPLGEGEAVLCRQVDNFPYMLMNNCGMDAVNAAIQELFVVGRTLDERGACDDDPPPSVKTTLFDAESSLKAARNDEVRRANVAAVLESMNNKTVEEYRKIILEQAAGDLFDLTFENRAGESVTVSIPRAPFENWALWRTNATKLAKPWNKVSRSGMKMQGDDPYHTDWMIGAGLDLNAMHDEENFASVAYEAMWNLQSEKGRFKASILCGSKLVSGEVVFPKHGEAVQAHQIAVIPNAGPDYVAAAMSGAGVITEQGGAMAHLVTVSREKDVTIMRVEDARKLYPEGTIVTLNPSSGEVHVSMVVERDAFGEI
jgi:phosphohistidine swiveling domain-containing protein